MSSEESVGLTNEGVDDRVILLRMVWACVGVCVCVWWCVVVCGGGSAMSFRQIDIRAQAVELMWK